MLLRRENAVLGPDTDRAPGILAAGFLHAGTGGHRSAISDEFSAVPLS